MIEAQEVCVYVYLLSEGAFFPACIPEIQPLLPQAEGEVLDAFTCKGPGEALVLIMEVKFLHSSEPCNPRSSGGIWLRPSDARGDELGVPPFHKCLFGEGWLSSRLSYMVGI